MFQIVPIFVSIITYKIGQIMKLTKTALDKLLSNLGLRLKIALALDCSEGTINRYLRQNHENLTKAAALEVIRTETGLTDDEILESNKVEAINN